jgi:NADH dehydrogenase
MEIIEDEAVSINETGRCLKSVKGDYYYDYLVIATGAEVNDFGVKGVKDNCLMFKTELDLQHLKNSIANTKDITIIGAGPTGIELAFKLSSLGKRVTVIEAGKEILPGFSDKMRSETIKHLNKSNILVKTGTQIKEVFKDGYMTNGEHIKDTSLKIWTCGIKPSSFARNFMNPLKPDGQLMVKPRIYAIGDSIIGHGPPTAQNASSQGLYLATIFNSEFKSLSTYKYIEKGRVIDATNCLIIEYRDNVITLPSLFRTIYESFTR